MDEIKPSFAGLFYEGDPLKLSNIIDKYISNTEKVVNTKPKAILVPHAGYIYSGQIAAWAYKQIIPYKYKRAILFGPSHQVGFDGIARASVKTFVTVIGDFNIDYSGMTDIKIIDEAFTGEHNIEVQLPFLKKTNEEIKIAPILTGYNVEIKSISDSLADSLLESDTLIIISTDLSHYLPYDECKNVDLNTIEMINKLDPKIPHAQACGADGLNILLTVAKSKNWKPIFLQYANSGDTAGDKTSVVGYTSFAFI